MAIISHHRLGTISVAAGGVAVTGAGTEWLAGGIRAGDALTAKGLTVSIASVEGAGALTLALPWPGSSFSGSAYEISYTPDASRVLAVARQVIEAAESGGGGTGADPDLAAHYIAQRNASMQA